MGREEDSNKKYIYYQILDISAQKALIAQDRFHLVRIKV